MKSTLPAFMSDDGRDAFAGGGMDIDMDGDSGMGEAASEFGNEKVADAEFYNDFEDDFDDEDLA